MTKEEQEAMIEEYFNAILDAFRTKALAYYGNAGNTRARFQRVTEMKNALKGIGKPETFGIGPGDYDHCPSGICSGGVCTQQLSFGGTAELRALAVELDLPPS